MKFSDGSTWALPVLTIAWNHAMHYSESEADAIEYLNNETLPLFGNSVDEIEDWAKNNMDWSDVADEAIKVFEPKTLDFQQEWMDCETMLK